MYDNWMIKTPGFELKKHDMYETTDKYVSHPDHYQSKTGLEVIDVIEAFTDGLEGIEATDTGNIIKYICRWKKKNGLQDLEKALWYLKHLVDHVKATPDPKADVKTKVLCYKCRHCGCEFATSYATGLYDLINHLTTEHHVNPSFKLDDNETIFDFVNKHFEKENV